MSRHVTPLLKGKTRIAKMAASLRCTRDLSGCLSNCLRYFVCYHSGYFPFRSLLPNLVIFFAPFNLLNLLAPRQAERTDRNEHHDQEIIASHLALYYPVPLSCQSLHNAGPTSLYLYVQHTCVRYNTALLHVAAESKFTATLFCLCLLLRLS